MLVEFDMLVVWLCWWFVDDMDLKGCVVVLNDFFFCEFGFVCNYNDYYDFDNSYLNVVLKWWCGILILLLVLYLEFVE